MIEEKVITRLDNKDISHQGSLKTSASTFFIVATPIGNLKDITYRAIEILNNVDVIVCEDTRYTLRLLDKYGIKKSLVSYHKYSNHTKEKQILNILLNGKNIAFVSDAGTPIIADPGNKLLKFLIQQNIKIEVIPGPSSIVAALVISSADLGSFTFCGWMPKKLNQKIKALKKFFITTNTLIFLESPHRLKKTIDDIYLASIGEDREIFSKIIICIAREMTKLHEEILRGNIDFIKKTLDKKFSIKGEIVLIFSKG